MIRRPASIHIWPPMFSRITVLLAAIFYVLFFGAAYHMGPGILALSIIPIGAAGATYGIWGGLIASVLFIPINLLLVNVGVVGGWTVLERNSALLSLVTGPLVGIAVGWMHHANASMRQRLADREKLEAALRQSEEKFHQLFEQAGEGIVLVDDQGIVIEWNQEQAHITGIRREQAVGQPMWLVRSWNLPALDTEARSIFARQAEQDIRAGFRTGGFPRAEQPANLKIVRLDGTECFVEFETNLITVGSRRILAGFTHDVTERNRVESALRETESRFRAAFEQSAIGMLLTSSRGQFLRTNRRFREIIGYTEEELQSMTWQDITYPDDLAGNLAFLKKMLTGEIDTFSTEKRYVRQDGRIVWANLTLSALARPSAPDGVQFFGVIEDITRRKQAEAALRDSETRYRSLYSAMREGVALHQLCRGLDDAVVDYVILDVNPAYESILGVEKADVIGRPGSEVYKANPPPYLDIYAGVVASGQSVSLETYFEPMDKTFNISVFSPFPGQFATIFTDISERKRIENALRDSEERFRSIVTNADAGYFFIDKDGIFRDVNAAWLKLYRFDSITEILGRHFSSIQVHEDVEMANVVAAGIMAGDGRYLTGEFSRKCRDGSVGYHTFSARPVTRFGEVIGLEGFIIDTTETRNAAQALRDSEARYRSLFEYSPVSLWEEDGSAVKAYLDELRTSGVEDLRTYFNEHPEALRHCASLVRIIRVNQTTLDMFGITSPEALYEGLNRILDDSSYDAFREELLALVNGQISYETEYVQQRIKGDPMVCILKETLIQGYESTWAKIMISLIDITPRKRAEDKLRENEAKLQALFEVLPEGVSLLSRDRQIVQFNPALGKILALSSGEMLNSAHEGRKYIHSDGTPMLPGEFPSSRAQQEQQAIHDVEIGVVTEDGTTVWTSVSAAPLPLPEAGVVVVTRDITERKQAENRLRENEAALKQAQRVAHVGSWRWSIQTDRLEWSDEMHRIFGIDPRTFSGDLGDVIARAIHPEDRAAVESSNLSVIVNHRPIPLEYRIIRPDGTVRTVWAEAGELILDESGSPAVLTGIVQDITERKRAEEALRQSEDHYRSIFENAPLGIFRSTPDGQPITANPAYARILGYESPDEFIAVANRQGMARTIEAEPDGQGGLPSEAALDGGWHSSENRYRRKDGEIITVNLLLRPVRHADGSHEWEGFIEDITERKYMEDAIRKAYLDLEQRVAERTVDLSWANDLLTQEVADRERAEAAEKEQRILAEALIDTATALNSTLDFEEVLDQILANLGRVVQHRAGNIMLIEDGVARIVRWHGYDEDYVPDEVLRSLRLPVLDTPSLRRMVETGQPLVIRDVREALDWVELRGSRWIRSYASAPIRIGNQVIGFLNLDSPEPGYFPSSCIDGLRAFADQAAIAIENARHYAQVQELAALQERNRIAHDLHDAVSQTLWSASLIADVLPAVWNRDLDEGQRSLQELRELAHGALAEMRALLLELRPAALVEVGLSEALRRLTLAFTGRTRVPVRLTIPDQCSLPPDVQVTLYRLVQEALNNIVRHAEASQVTVTFACDPTGITLHIIDNGRGFDLDSIPAGHLGLAIMRERAESIGAMLTITSQPGHGTHIDITWAADAERGIH